MADIEIQTNNLPTSKPTLVITPTPTTIIYNEEVVVEDNNDFYIDIPKIGAKSKVIADVSPTDKKNYLKVLENNNIAHSNLSALPGNGKGSTTYLFAHSTEQSVKTVRKNSVFYLLGELGEKDKILVNYRGQNIEYQVYMKKVITAKETEYLTYSDTEKEVLILQTCWPIGTNWKRLLVFAQRI
jgi:LPXTG-site transpeptidase (sortase) family protein